MITAETMNKELFKVCCRMLQELNDGHVSIEPNFREDDIECGPPYQFIHDIEFGSDEEVQKLESLIANELEKQGFSTASKRKLSEGTNFQFRSSSSFGYLRLDEMTEKITFGKFRRAVDRSIKEFENKRGLIIDLRFNGGGWDYNAYALASRFVPKGKTIGHLERTRIKGTDEYTPMKYRTVKSRGKRQFTGPIVILTSDFTASAAEVFVLLMKELPNVTIIGDETEGIFSDMYEFKLPNKWKVSLSHQQYFSTDGENYEGRGIPPEVKIVNSKVDLVNQIDPVIRQAINHLEKENNP
ncbi:MAG: S41 family peptidase [Saprospiraceae bacterium]|nr:S41 family peptidase [Saprospiraceae bacterium]